MDLTYLFIAHDLLMIQYISDKIGVMVHGKIVEIANCDELYNHPAHPYTKALISSILVPDPRRPINQEHIKNDGNILLVDNNKGCCFKNRCPYAISKCKKIEPNMKEVTSNHFVACHLI